MAAAHGVRGRAAGAARAGRAARAAHPARARAHRQVRARLYGSRVRFVL